MQSIQESADRKYQDTQEDLAAAQRINFESQYCEANRNLREGAISLALNEREQSLRAPLTEGGDRYFIINPAQRQLLAQTILLDKQAIQHDIFDRTKKLFKQKLNIKE